LEIIGNSNEEIKQENEEEHATESSGPKKKLNLEISSEEGKQIKYGNVNK